MNNQEYFEIKKHINNRLKDAREKHRYTVRELAEIAEMSHTYLSNLENNHVAKPSLYTYLKLFEILEISPGKLFYEIENLPPFDNQNKE